ncbi:MAG: VCBS repeat-containing protein [Candidatus Hinthialibacter antarcticus]|nr:VCBS repeat-containing protein [Candidatus Hinthialibacter antarcticus]
MKNRFLTQIICIVIFSLIACSGQVSFSEEGGVKIGPRPGEDNPYGAPSRWTLYRDDELALFSFNSNDDEHKLQSDKVYVNENTDDLKIHDGHRADDFFHWDEINHPGKYAAAAGRFNVESDEVATAHYVDDTRWRVSFFNNDLMRVRNVIFEDAGEGLLDIVAGDFIAVADDDEQFEDEIIVARAYKDGSSYSLAFTVFNQLLNPLLQQAPIELDTGGGAEPIGIKADKGDFNNDGITDLVIVVALKEKGIVIYPFSFSDNYTTITAWDKHTHTHSHNVSSVYFDLAVGDFNGDNLDDIAVSYENLRIYSTVSDDTTVFEYQSSIDYPPDVMYSAQIVSGLFHYEPDLGYDVNRSQIGLVYSSPSANNRDRYSVQLYRVYKNFELHEFDTNYGSHYEFNQNEVWANQFSCSAGNFIFHDDPDQPPNLSEICLSIPGIFSALTVLFKINDDKVEVFDSATERESGFGPVVCVAYDSDGDALKLGAPAHLVTDNFISLDTAMMEPPKHVDYLPLNPEEWHSGSDHWGVINVNSYPDFNVDYVNEDETSGSIASSEQSSRSWAWSWSAKYSESLRTGPKSDNTTVSISAAYKMSGSKARSQKNWDEHYQETQKTISMKTNEDDMLQGNFQLIDIWRYPILNQTDEDGAYLYQDVFLPGPKYSFIGGGLGHEFYQPRHVNHNLLTYPRFSESFPSGVGAYSVIEKKDDSDKIIEQDASRPWNDLNHIDYSPNDVDVHVSFNDAEKTGYSISHNHSFNHDVDFHAKISLKEDVGVEAAKQSLALSFSSKWRHHWGDNTTKKYEQSNTKSVKILQPDIPLPDPGWGFGYVPAVFVSSSGGAWKTKFAIDQNTLGDRWRNYYGGRPDLGLALPHRFHASRADKASFDRWSLVTETERMAMRGGFLYEMGDDDEEEIHNGAGIEEGDVVIAAARVYNLCLSQEAGPFMVRFEAALFDVATAFEVEGERILIGETVIENLNPLEMQEASVEWDTTGFGLEEEDASLVWRIYVTVDPYDEVAGEIHEWKDETNIGVEGWTDEHGRLYHGNNEGYFPHHDGYFVGKQLSQVTLPGPLQAYKHDESLAIQYEQQLLTSGEIRVPLGKKYKLRTHLQCEKADLNRIGYVVFHDKDPGQTNEVIAVQTIRSLKKDNYAWATWEPVEKGEYALWSVFLEDSDDPNPGDASDVLHVTVYDPNDTAIEQWALFE